MLNKLFIVEIPTINNSQCLLPFSFDLYTAFSAKAAGREGRVIFYRSSPGKQLILNERFMENFFLIYM